MIVRSLAFNILFVANFIAQAVLLCPLLVLPRERIWWIPRGWARSSLWLHRTICGVEEEYRGLSNRVAGGSLVAAKHQSTWETLALVLVFDRPAFIIKRELTWVPLFGWYALKFGMIPVDRGKRSEALAAMAARAAREIAGGRPIIIFPEGTRRAAGAPPAYRYGVVRLYQELNVPCLPVALNSGLFWPRRAVRHHAGTIVMDILPPIPPGMDTEGFAALLRETIESATDGLIRLAAERDPSLSPAGPPPGE